MEGSQAEPQGYQGPEQPAALEQPESATKETRAATRLTNQEARQEGTCGEDVAGTDVEEEPIAQLLEADHHSATITAPQAAPEEGEQPAKEADRGAPSTANILQIKHAEDDAVLLVAMDVLDLAAESSDLLEGQEGSGKGESEGDMEGLATSKVVTGEKAQPGLEVQVVGAIKALRLGDLAQEEAGAAGRAGAGGAPSTGRTPRAPVSPGRKPRKFSFSAPPHVPRPKTAVRHNFSHSPQRVRQILRDNDSLVRRLGNITYSASRMEQGAERHDKLVNTVLAGCAQRRQSEASKIVRQNLELYKRLQAVKVSPAVSRKEHRKSFAKSREYVANIAAVKRSSTGADAWSTGRRASVAAAPRAAGAWPEPEGGTVGARPAPAAGWRTAGWEQKTLAGRLGMEM